MTPDEARAELVEQAAHSLFERFWVTIVPESLPWDQQAEEFQNNYRKYAEAVLRVVESATTTCEITHMDQEQEPCPVCGGEPGPLLILQALGGEGIQDDLEGNELWRFPRPQETTP